MKTIETYIQFAIDNGYYADDTFKKLKIEKNVKFVYEEGDDDYERPESYAECEGLYILDFIADVGTGYKNIKDIITSKLFIEAITKGVIKEIAKEKGQELSDLQYGITFEPALDNITTNQAIAIRDGKLEEFITNILGK